MKALTRWESLAGVAAATFLAAFVALVAPAQAAFPGRDGLLAVQPLKGPGIVLLNAKGGGERRVCATPATGAQACSLVRPEWSPDGQTLAVGSGPSVVVIYPDGSCLACQFPPFYDPIVDAAFTSNPTVLTTVVMPPWGGLYTFGFDGQARTSQALLRGAVSEPVWSSRGELALVRGGRIWVGSPHSLHRLARGSGPAWSPDGSRIVFERNGWLLVRRLRARIARRLLRGSAPAWSPDGRWIAFFDKRHRLSVVRASGGRVRRIGSVSGRTVDWQPLPATPPAACLTPPGSTVLAGSDTAIVSLDSAPGDGSWAAMGCLRGDGRERVLASSRGRGYAADLMKGAVLAGTFAALEVAPSCGTSSLRSAPIITVYDLQTGTSSGYYGSRSGVVCIYSVPPSIDPLLLNPNGFAAWLVTQSDDAQQLYAHDNQGTTIVDSAPAGSVTAISNVQLAGDQLTWTHNGTPQQHTLQ